MQAAFDNWLGGERIEVIALTLFLAMAAATIAGGVVRRLVDRVRQSPEGEERREGYVVSAVLGLLALLLGFTFSIALSRFEARRLIVVEEANAIGTAYLRAQLLDEPHRSRMTTLLIRYTDNRIALAKAKTRPAPAALLAANDALLTDIWTAASAAFPTIPNREFSAIFLSNLNEVIDLDATRKAARRARVPTAVMGGLFAYVVVSSGILGFALGGRTSAEAATLLLLLTLVLTLIVDVDRPLAGRITESQAGMEEVRQMMAHSPPEVFDRWREPPAR